MMNQEAGEPDRNIEAKRWQERLCGRGIMLPEICLGLRGACNGSADPWQPDLVKETLAMLQARMDSWRPGRKVEERFDNAVKELVAATMEEVKAYIQETVTP